METKLADTYQKALTVNLDSTKYGTIAEIGAGQETARWFFKVGGAAGTIAKAMSAYDMCFSDSIYGPCERYVSRERMEAMLDHEYSLIIERLDETRGGGTTFFAFANTVTVHSYTHTGEGDGWLGIRFQTQPREVPSQIVLHVRLLGQDSAQDQETLGVLGVNLIYGAMHLYRDPRELLEALLDNLTIDNLEIDLLDFSGPVFADIDNRLMALLLVEQGASNAAMFTADGKVVQPGDILHKKAIMIERSRFRPPTKLTMNLLEFHVQSNDRRILRHELGQSPFLVRCHRIVQIPAHQLCGFCQAFVHETPPDARRRLIQSASTRRILPSDW